jgi:hypothetical protein
MKRFACVVLCLLALVRHMVAFTNTPPTLYVQSTAECPEGLSIDIKSVRIDDADAHQYTQPKLAVNLTVSHGQIYLPFRTGLYFVYGNIAGPDSRFEIIGKLADVKKSLSLIKYLADADFNGKATLEITAFDMHLQSRSGDSSVNDLALLPDHPAVMATTVITVLPDNDAPTISASARYLTCDQQQVEADGTPAISTASFRAVLADGDLITPELQQNTKFQLSLTTRFGTLRLPGKGCDFDGYTCTVIDTLPNLNKLTSKITYVPNAGYNKFQGSERIGEFNLGTACSFCSYHQC